MQQQKTTRKLSSILNILSIENDAILSQGIFFILINTLPVAVWQHEKHGVTMKYTVGDIRITFFKNLFSVFIQLVWVFFLFAEKSVNSAATIS